MHRNISRHKRMMRDDVCIFFAMKCKQMVHAAVGWKLGTTLLGADLFRGYFFGASFRLFEYEVNFFEATAVPDCGPTPVRAHSCGTTPCWARKLGYFGADRVANELPNLILRSHDRRS
jgi:hypothetical protein